jgi:hypothetical protein
MKNEEVKYRLGSPTLGVLAGAYIPDARFPSFKLASALWKESKICSPRCGTQREDNSLTQATSKLEVKLNPNSGIDKTLQISRRPTIILYSKLRTMATVTRARRSVRPDCIVSSRDMREKV